MKASRTILLLSFALVAATASAQSNTRQTRPPAAPPVANQVVPAAVPTEAAQTLADIRGQALDRREAIVEARAELHDAGMARLEWIAAIFGAVVGLLGVAITVAIVFFAIKTKEAAVFEAKKEIAGEREAIAVIRDQAESALNEIAAKQAEIEAHREKSQLFAREIEQRAAATNALATRPAEAEAATDDRSLAEDKPLRDLTESEFMARIAAASEGDPVRTIELSIAMRQMFESDEAQSFATFYEAWAYGETDRHRESITAYDRLIRRFRNDDRPSIRSRLASAMFNKGLQLTALGLLEDAAVTYSEVKSLFGGATGDPDREEAAKSAVNQGYVLAQLGRSEEAIAVFDDVLARYGDDADPALRLQVAMALYNKGGRLLSLDRPEDAVRAYDDVLARFDGSDDPAMHVRLAKTLVNRAVALETLGRRDEAIATNERVAARFRGRDGELCNQVAKALFNTACWMAKDGNAAKAVETLRAWGDSNGAFDCAMVAADSDFDRVRTDPLFVALLRENGCAA